MMVGRFTLIELDFQSCLQGGGSHIITIIIMVVINHQCQRHCHRHCHRRHHRWSSLRLSTQCGCFLAGNKAPSPPTRWTNWAQQTRNFHHQQFYHRHDHYCHSHHRTSFPPTRWTNWARTRNIYYHHHFYHCHIRYYHDNMCYHRPP